MEEENEPANDLSDLETSPYAISGRYITRYNDNDDENNSETFYDKVRRHVKSFMPHFGLWSLTVFYIIVGACYFYYHESAFEVESRNQKLSDFYALRNIFNDKLGVLIKSNISRKTFDKSEQELFETIVSQIFKLQHNPDITIKHLFNKTETENDDLFWSFSNSIFFATTLISTIGYTTKLAPATIYGKVGCMIFSAIGIPLFLVTVADMGRYASEMIVWCYRNYRNLKINIIQKIQSISNLDIISLDFVEFDVFDRRPFGAFILIFLFTYVSVGGLLLKFLKRWSFVDSFFVCFNVLAKIGHNNKVPSENDNPFIIMAYIFVGISLVTICIDVYGTVYINNIHYFGEMISRIIFRIKNLRKKIVSPGENVEQQ